MQSEIWSLGAESTILRVERWGRLFALKWRHPKPYLLKAIDDQLRSIRTLRECKMLDFARTIGIPTPAVYSVDLSNKIIMMDFIMGNQVKQIVPRTSDSELRSMCVKFGHLIATLHRHNVVHGDPTTSNLVIDGKSRLWLIDFGLGEWNATVEMKGVDLHLIRRALETTHWDRQELMLESTLEGYREVLGEAAETIINKMNEIRERGRYH